MSVTSKALMKSKLIKKIYKSEIISRNLCLSTENIAYNNEIRIGYKIELSKCQF